MTLRSFKALINYSRSRDPPLVLAVLQEPALPAVPAVPAVTAVPLV